ncbi:Hypothetical predicted protein [Marmota monax]|uniref:Uncharacterized protein n=1 Tax=Marmota monax TaxID=9995 RepID=A0A5E4BHA2_MARMO|nr:hypothetical protein GHT09_001944 [Marmota monax]VTJ68420.1 Hypothetical predicted protein [Marmota monax]
MGGSRAGGKWPWACAMLLLLLWGATATALPLESGPSRQDSTHLHGPVCVRRAGQNAELQCPQLPYPIQTIDSHDFTCSSPGSLSETSAFQGEPLSYAGSASASLICCECSRPSLCTHGVAPALF